MIHLFTPLKLRQLTLRNRIFMAPMCQFCANDGLASSWHWLHYGSRAVGGVGLVVVEATAVSPEGMISAGDLGLWQDRQTEAMAPLVKVIRDHGAVAGIQLGHAGRKASHVRLGPGRVAAEGQALPMLAPSAIPFEKGGTLPRAMDEEEIEGVVNSFVQATKRAAAAGFQVVELHMAHGYLLHQFLSPLSNKRQDHFGGSWENRVRLPLRVAEEVRRVWPEERPLFVRISATDWVENGWDITQSVRLVHGLKERGVDFIDCSTGGVVPDARVPIAPGYQVPFSATIRRETALPTGAVGLITEPAQAEAILSQGEADAILLGRVLLRDPYWPLHASRVLKSDFPWPFQYVAGQ